MSLGKNLVAEKYQYRKEKYKDHSPNHIEKNLLYRRKNKWKIVQEKY